MIQGTTVFFSGLIMMFSHSSLRDVLWRMMGLLCVLMLVLISCVFFLSEYLVALWMPDGDQWYWVLVGYLASLLAMLLSVVVGAVAFVTLASAAVAPWLDTLAFRTEKILGKQAVENDASWATQAFAALSNAIRPLLALMLWGLLALLFFWFPPLATIIWTYGSLQFLNYELFDTQASRHGLVFKERKQNMQQHQWFWLGFGGTALLLMIVPILNIFVLPAAVVALAKRG